MPSNDVSNAGAPIATAKANLEVDTVRMITSESETDLQEKGLARRSELSLSDRDFAQLDGILSSRARSPLRREVLKRRLESELINFRMAHDEWRKAIPNKEVKSNLRAVATAAQKLAKASVNSRPKLERALEKALKRDEVMVRLRGLLILIDEAEINASGYDDAALVTKFLKHPQLVRALARKCLEWNAGSRNRSWPGLPTYNPPIWLFTSVLLRFWRFRLRRKISNWQNANRSRSIAAPMTRFVNDCLLLAGHDESLTATKKRIAEVIAHMDRGDKTRSRAGWSVL